MDQRLKLSRILNDILHIRAALVGLIHADLRSLDLTEQEWRVIDTLANYGELESGALANRVCVPKPTVTRILVRLETSGVIKRRKMSGDRRMTFNNLTKKGNEVALRHRDALYDSMQPLLDEFGTENFSAFANHSHKIANLLHQSDSSNN